MRKSLAIVASAALLVVAISLVSAEVAAFVVVAMLLLVLPGLAYLDAVNVPSETWSAEGRSRSRWTVSFFIIPFGVSMIATLVYWAWLRRRLPGGALRPGEQVVVGGGLHQGRMATLSRRSLMGLGGAWLATVEESDGSTATVQVTSDMVARSSAPATAGFSSERSTDRAPRRRVTSVRNRLGAAGLLTIACGTVVLSVGAGDEASAGPLVVALGSAAIALGLFQVIYVRARFSNRRRLPKELRPADLGQLELVSLEMQDGQWISAIPVLPGGFVFPRPTDPPFDAADVEAVFPATAEEIEVERFRQSIQRRA